MGASARSTSATQSLSITGETSNSGSVMSAFAAAALNRAIRFARSGSPAV